MTIKSVQEHFATLVELGIDKNYKPWNIYNMDESFLAIGSGKVRVIVFTGGVARRRGIRKLPKVGEHITLVLCVAADGKQLTPGLILPLKQLPQSCREYIGYYAFSGSEKGWMNRVIFREWVCNVFIPEAKKRRDELGDASDRIFLLLDSHSSRRAPVTLQHLKDENIDVVTIPAHSSHILQPLDLTVFAAFKNYLRSNLSFKDATTADQKRACVLKATHKALYFSLYPETVQSGFARAGIHPFDPALILLRSDLIQPTDKPSDKLSRHKGGGISIDGKVLTSETIIQQLRNEAATKPAKGSSFTPSLHQNLLTHWT